MKKLHTLLGAFEELSCLIVLSDGPCRQVDNLVPSSVSLREEFSDPKVDVVGEQLACDVAFGDGPVDVRDN